MIRKLPERSQVDIKRMALLSGDKLSASELISQLCQKIYQVLEPLIDSEKPVALLDFPDHSNVGDNAIWLGEKEVLRKLGVRVIYSSDFATYSKEMLSKKIGDGIILIHGGGNLGDLWPVHQEFRERVIADFPNNKIIQLPQSIYFKEKENLDRARKIFDSHYSFILLLRDNVSFKFAKQEFKSPSFLCPDMAFVLGSLDRPGAGVFNMLCLLRSDSEAIESVLPNVYKSLRKIEWVKDDKTLLYWFNKLLTNFILEFPRRLKLLGLLHSKFCDRVASERLRRGARQLSEGSFVITDRLHGHILSLLLGIPHVIMDNNYGKIRSFYETWTKECDIASWANSPEEAYNIARSLTRSNLFERKVTL